MPSPAQSLAGKSALITGVSTYGIGFCAAIQLISLGLSTLHITSRSSEGGAAARVAILAHPTVKALKSPPSIYAYELDLSTYEGTKKFASNLLASTASLHIVILNAGMVLWDFRLAPTGNELSLQVNYLSNAFLILLLLPLLSSTAEATGVPSRLSLVSSRMHEKEDMKAHPPVSGFLESFNDKSRFGMASSYSNAKLLDVLFIKELAAHVDPKLVILSTVCPGFTQTKSLDDQLPYGLGYIMGAIRKVIAQPSDKGAANYTWAVAHAGPDSHGLFIAESRIPKPSKFVKSEVGQKTQEILWKESMDVFCKLEPTVAKAVGA